LKSKTILCIQKLEIFSNQKLGELSDESNGKIAEISQWINKLYQQSYSESKVRSDRCEICHSKEDPSDFEGHHIGGRKHDYRQITSCKSCHRWLSDRQKVWDSRWLDENQSENLRMAFFHLGLQNILILKSKKTQCSLYEELADSFTEKISELLKRG